MKGKSVIFIEPRNGSGNVFENYMRLPLLGTLYLGTILHEQGYHVRILNENILGKDVDPFELRADVFCITSLTVSANRAAFLARQLKSIYPQALLLIGGIHASLVPEDFADVADHVVIGEAEDNIVDLVEGRYEERIVKGGWVQDLERLPLINYSLLEGYETLDIVPIMTSRGCPFNCHFCTVTKIFGRHFRMVSPQRVLQEIENAQAYFSSPDFFFYDDNFTVNRRRIRELCNLIIERRLGITWAAQVRTDLAKQPQTVELMVKAGCRWLYVGFESIDDDTLAAMNKSQTRGDIERAIHTFHAAGMNIHGMFMFGEDHDTLDSIDRTVAFAREHRIDTVQFMIMTPFPGTECYDKIVAEGRLFHRNWDYYNGMFIVFQPKQMNPAKLQSGVLQAYRSFYSLRRTAFDGLKLLGNVTLDATVWNFNAAQKYKFDVILMRADAKTIVGKCAPVFEHYQSFLARAEQPTADGAPVPAVTPSPAAAAFLGTAGDASC